MVVAVSGCGYLSSCYGCEACGELLKITSPCSRSTVALGVDCAHFQATIAIATNPNIAPY